MTYYEDGDKEHMLEDEISKYVVKKRMRESDA